MFVLKGKAYYARPPNFCCSSSFLIFNKLLKRSQGFSKDLIKKIIVFVLVKIERTAMTIKT